MYVAEKTHICDLSAKTSTSFIFFANGEVQQCRGQLRAQGVGNALYGLRSLGDSKEVRQLVAALTEKVPRRAAAKLGRAELRALTFLEARYGAFSAKMQTAGTLRGNLRVTSGYPPGTLYISPGPNLENPAKIRQNLGKI